VSTLGTTRAVAASDFGGSITTPLAAPFRVETDRLDVGVLVAAAGLVAAGLIVVAFAVVGFAAEALVVAAGFAPAAARADLVAAGFDAVGFAAARGAFAAGFVVPSGRSPFAGRSGIRVTSMRPGGNSGGRVHGEPTAICRRTPEHVAVEPLSSASSAVGTPPVRHPREAAIHVAV
jgi:hypothetical protein